ncbi:hypothetical protein [Autumnicola musiva]|uniref:Uncharacterized protein n=1 Tax=Autumnicola musiva TaxID=3075589 RepID=A0ABU3D790_9FLAO|nr:hypothetical protein [Zunongwangia sp. F117]MDT0677401.1 hypothetical protein [Zunongwangia sp. F117]
MDFLGKIDSKSDAILWAYGHEYYFQLNEISNGGIKKVEDGYELILLKTVMFCTPVQTNRFHLRISTDGKITILEEEVYEKDENACV